MSKLWVVLLVLLSILPATSFASREGSDELFTPAREADIHVLQAERNGAQFVEMERARFEALASSKEFTCLIPNFPLASDGNFDLRVEQFEVVAKDMKGKPASEHLFFRGSVDGMAESHVCLTIFADRAWGYITANGKTYSIASAGRTEMGNLILGVQEDNTTPAIFSCGMDDMTKRVVSPAIQKIMAEGTKHKYSDRTMSNSIPQFSIGLEMDYPCVQHCGGTDSDAFKYGLTVIAAISDIYLRDAGMTFVCSEHLEWTTPDTYQSDSIGDPLLNEFDGSNLTGGAPSLFMLLSGRQMHWAVGIAKGVGILCQGGQSACVCGMTNSLKKNGWDYPYHSMIRDVMVCSHETGHLVACFHTQDCSWNPALDSCVTCENYGSPTPGYCYDTPVPTRGTIMSYCQSYILKFHPRCVDAIQQMIPSYSCFTNVSVPQLTILPSKQIQECAGGQYHFTCSASNGTGPYLFEVNPPPDSLIASGNNCTIVLNPAKAQKFYVRLADGESVRVYDSITFSPLASFVVNVSMDSVISGPDSMVLTAHMPGLSDSVAYVWFKLPNALGRSAGNSNTFTVSRKTASRYSIRIATSGGCVAFDTVLVTATPSLGAVTGARSGEPVGSSIYPNPATQWLSAILPSPSVQCWIEDVLGRRMDAIASVSPNGASSQRIDFDLSRLSSGTYWLVWDAAGKISVSSFVKQ